MLRTKKLEIAAEATARTIKRRVFFYRIDAGINPDTGQPKEINFSPSLHHLHKLPFTNDARYLDSDNDKQLCCYVDSLQSPYRLRLANIRRSQHPPVEEGGIFAPLNLKAGKGLAEITHLVLFPDRVCGVEFNYYGPRPTQLQYYFGTKLHEICPTFRMVSIARPDLEARLAALNDVKLLNIKARASFASVLAEADQDLGAAFRANVKAVDARPEDELELKFVRKKNKKLTQRSSPFSLLQGIRTLSRRADLKEQVSILKVADAGEQSSRVVDVIHEQFTASKNILPASNNSGGVDSNAMFAAIEEAYTEFRSQLATASEIS